MASDRGKQQAYCKVCSKHFSVSHGGIDDVHRHGQNGFLKKITDFPRFVPHFFFRNLTCLNIGLKSILIEIDFLKEKALYLDVKQGSLVTY